MWWQRILERRRRKRDLAGQDIAFWRLQSMFNNFRRILERNNAILEGMASMDRALGGEYIFDRAFLEQSVRRISSDVHHVVYSLNALTGNRHVPLYDRYQDIRTILDDILAGDVRALAGTPVLPLHQVGWELEPLVGMEAACMAELLGHDSIVVAPGCVLTVEGARQLAGFSIPHTPCPPHPAEPHRGLFRAFAQTPPSVSSEALRAEVFFQLTEQLELLGRDDPAGVFYVVFSWVGASTADYGTEDSALDEQCLVACRLVPCADDFGIRAEIEFVHDRVSGFAASFQDAGIQAVSHAALLKAILEVLYGALADSCNAGEETGKLQWGVAAVITRSLPCAVRGEVHSRARTEEHVSGAGQAGPFPVRDVLSITARSNDMADAGDRFLLHRIYPYSPVQADIAPRAAKYRFADGRQATSIVESGMARGSALLRQDTMRVLAETAMTLERMLGVSVKLEWELGEDGTCRIIRATPRPFDQLEMDDGMQADALAAELDQAVVIARGGHMIQSGVAAGRVVHVSETMRAEDFPVNAVAVAQIASPRLTPVLQRSSAILCENGTIAGHLATVARELRIPAVFGIPNVLAHIPDGSFITLDAAETKVYEGVLPHLLRFAMAGADLYPTDPEYRTLRRLLRFISPLHLVDPDAPEFTPQGCRTFHDLIHYCHEMAVDELAHFQERRPGLGSIRTRRMQLGRPMDIRVLDIDDGLVENVSAAPRPDEVTSGPFAAFLEGLLRPEAWNTAPPVLGFRDVMSSMPRSMNMLTASPDVLGENLAIVSRDYVNISLRLGYHFSVVDAFLGTDPQRNHVYFRFAGGLADPERRNRRARFIRDVLESMAFKVTLNGDLVVGSLKQVDAASMRSALFLLGALTAFSRQRDTGLYTDADMKALFDAFHAAFLRHFSTVSPVYDIAERMTASIVTHETLPPTGGTV